MIAHRQSPPVLALAMVIAAAVGSVGCGESSECSSGSIATCICPNGTQYMVTCKANKFPTCQCPSSGPDAGVDAAVPGDVPGDVAAPTVTLTTLSDKYLRLVCSGCHDGSVAMGAPDRLPGRMSLKQGMAYANIVNVPSVERPELMRIKPGDPDSSYLYLKLARMTGDPAIKNEQMPLDGPYYSDLTMFPDTLRELRQWILDGAQDN